LGGNEDSDRTHRKMEAEGTLGTEKTGGIGEERRGGGRGQVARTTNSELKLLKKVRFSTPESHK